MDDKYFVVIHPDGFVKLERSDGGAKEIHRLVEGYFENVYIRIHGLPVVISVNEEMLINDSAFNFLATRVTEDSVFVCGPAVLMKLVRLDNEYEELDQVPFSYEEVLMIFSHVEELRYTLFD